MKYTIQFLLATLILMGCADSQNKSAKNGLPQHDSADAFSTNYYTLEFPINQPIIHTASKEEELMLTTQLRLKKNYMTALEEWDFVDFTEIKEGNLDEYEKLMEFNPNSEGFLKAYYGECWENRPKTFHDLDMVTIKRSSFIRIRETDFEILKLLNLFGFEFSRKKRLYYSNILYSGKHICGEKQFDYYIRVGVGYMVDLKRGGIKISDIQQLTAEIKEKRATARYTFVSEGIKVNPNSEREPKFENLSSGIFNDKINLALDKKIDYLFGEISKKNGAFIGQPIPSDFDIVVTSAVFTNKFQSRN